MNFNGMNQAMPHFEIENLDVRQQQLLQLVDNFREKLKVGTSDPEKFMTISEIEQLWSDLKGDTSALYSDILQEALSEVDESVLLRKKKLNIRKEG